MRKIYIGVAAFLILSVSLFVVSFIYLDKSRHDTYYYTVALNAKIVGTIRVDRFATEDKLVYKSLAETPFYPVYTESRSKLELSRDYALESYSKERLANRFIESMSIENVNGLASFVSRYRSKFSFVDDIPIKKNTFIFEEDSPMTYIPLLENYNFSKGRSQGFSALMCPPSASTPAELIDALPPISRFVTLTSIKDEYLKVDSRKIKTENLILKIRDYPGGAIWVAKSDRAVIKIELPAKGITITRSFKPKIFAAKKPALQDPRYISKEVIFKTPDSELAGTMTVPTREGPFPAVLLLGGDEPSDRDREGLFMSIADYLSKNGFCVLRFDRRGTGLNKADTASATDDDEVKDAAAALKFLKEQTSAERGKIAVLGHAKGASYALRLASMADQINGLIIMAPVGVNAPTAEDISKEVDGEAESFKWPDSYRALVMRTFNATGNKVKESGGDWITILGRRCYTGNMRGASVNASELAKNVAIPVYILQGKEDDDYVIRSAFDIEKALEASGNKSHSIKLFGYLGRFFGNIVNDGVQKIHYDPDKAVMEHIKSWLDKTFAEPTKPADAAALPENTAPNSGLN